MYDRKTWVILTICGALLAANLYFQGQNQKAAAEKARQEQASKPAAAPAAAPSPETPPAPNAGLTVEPPPPPAKEELVVLKNDKVTFTLSNIGGGIEYAEFADEYEFGSTTKPVRMNRSAPGPIGALAGPEQTIENAAYAYKGDESVEGEKAVFIAQLPSGLIAKKTFSLKNSDKPGAPYLLDFELSLENAAANSINLGQWSVFAGEAVPKSPSEFAQYTGYFWRTGNKTDFKSGSSFKGGMFSSAKIVQTAGDDEKIQYAGVGSQFFAIVIRPAEPMAGGVWAKPDPVTIEGASKPVTAVTAGLELPPVTLNPHEQKSFSYVVFIGPKHNNMLQKMDKAWGDGWGDVINYGWFWWVSRPLNWLLNTYHNIIDGIANGWAWGLAIILLTITVRTLIWPLHAKSTRTMKRMAKLKPEMEKLKEKYADDPNKLNTETMGLYRKFGINPLGGCLPMFIQIPIFYGFFSMLRYAVELRGHGFLWIDDLSQPDTMTHIAGIPINLLPIVMAGTSFLQMRMTPQTADKTQQRIMMFMPLMFFFFCYNYASALALYWTTQNIFSIGQTWLMNKVPEPELKPTKGAAKKSWVQRMAERQAELQKTQKAGVRPGAMRDVTPDKKKPRPPRTGG